MRLVFMCLLASCIGDKDVAGADSSAGDPDSDAPDTDTGSDTDTDDTDSWRDPEKALLVIRILIDVEELYAFNSSGGDLPLSGPYPADGVVMSEVEPAEWWVVAYNVDMTACDASDVVILAAGDQLDWTVSEFPGSFDADTFECLTP